MDPTFCCSRRLIIFDAAIWSTKTQAVMKLDEIKSAETQIWTESNSSAR